MHAGYEHWSDEDLAIGVTCKDRYLSELQNILNSVERERDAIKKEQERRKPSWYRVTWDNAEGEVITMQVRATSTAEAFDLAYDASLYASGAGTFCRIRRED
jgi:hypothetical protein